MTQHEKVISVKKIAKIQAQTDEDVKWAIENQTKQGIYVDAFAEGFMYCDKLHSDVFECKPKEDEPLENTEIRQ